MKPAHAGMGEAARAVDATLRSIRHAVCLLVLLVGFGTLWFHLVEGAGVFDSLYFTVITVATVGFGETIALDTGGRMFTMALIVTSLGLVGYVVAMLTRFIVEGEFSRIVEGRRMDKRIAQIKDHIILCGAGRTGAEIAHELHRTLNPFVAVESNPEAIEHLLRLGDIPYIKGDATTDESLEAAGIERARGLVAALGDDKDNTYVVLSARALNPRLRIVARLDEAHNERKLRKAGADEVVSPNSIGGLRMASVMIRPSVVSFLDAMLRVTGETIRVEEVAIEDGGEIAGRTVADSDIRRRTGMLIVAVKDRTGAYDFNPEGGVRLDPGHVLIVMGSPDQVQSLRKIASK